MLPIGRCTQRYTFSLKICDSVGTLVDMTIGTAQTPDGLAKGKEAIHKVLEEFAPMPIGVKTPVQGAETHFTPSMIIKLREGGGTAPDPDATAGPVENTPDTHTKESKPIGPGMTLELRNADGSIVEVPAPPPDVVKFITDTFSTAPEEENKGGRIHGQTDID